MTNPHPPRGSGAPLGIAGMDPRIGPCSFGSALQPADGPPVKACPEMADVVVVVTEPDGTAVQIPLCEKHMAVLEEAEELAGG